MFLFSTNAGVFARRYDRELGDILYKEFRTELEKTETGKNFFTRFDSAAGCALPRILIQHEDKQRLALFETPDAPVPALGGTPPAAVAGRPATAASAGRETGKIYFNAKYLEEFFESRRQKQSLRKSDVMETLYAKPDLRKQFVSSAAAIYLHEMTHCLQTCLYPNYKYDVPQENAIEFEYEAYFVEDMYFHEKMKQNPRLLKDFIRGAYEDLYLEHSIGSYLALSLDLDMYKEKIWTRYSREENYLTIEKAEAVQKSKIKDSKISAYAAGKFGNYLRQMVGLDRLSWEKTRYHKFLEDFYKKFWPGFSAEALMFVGSTAVEAKNYPLALDCFSAADVNSAKLNINPDKFEELKRKAAMTILETASFIKDHGAKMETLILFEHFKALDNACKKTNRPFPAGLEKPKNSNYRKALKIFLKKSAEEKDSEKIEYYKENMDYLMGVLAAGKI